jgi:WD40 repeat protein
MTKTGLLFFAAVTLFALAASLFAQEPCKVPEIVYNRGVDSLFTEEQEVFLGDTLAETIDKELSVMADETASVYLTSIGERLARHLPVTTIKFRFFIVDAPEVNAFSVAGGRIYLTRKLITFVNSEDELAGIIGHEMGHAVVHHTSADFSRAFREILGVQKLGDRDDVYRKVHELLDRSHTKQLKGRNNHEDDRQLEADRIGLYAMAAAGFDPKAVVTAWERLVETGKDNDRWGGLFGRSSPESKRLREMLRSIESIPTSCRENAKIKENETFKSWKLSVVSLERMRHAEHVPGLISKGSLQPFLRASIDNLKFSPDGQYLIAQDSSGINLLQREPFGFLFRINIADAKFAAFSPDSKRIIIQTYRLRVETWDIASRRAASVNEVYVRERCLQTRISPDGKTLVCYSTTGDLSFIDVESNERIFSKEKFFGAPVFIYGDSKIGEIDLIQMKFSPDGKYFVAAGGVGLASLGHVFPGDAWGYRLPFVTPKSFTAYDLTTRAEIKVADTIKNIARMPFTFYSNDQVVGQNAFEDSKFGIFTFPGGERVEKFQLSGISYEKATGSDCIIVRPIQSDPAGVYSVALKKFVLTSKSKAIDGFGEVFATEGASGNIDLVKISSHNEIEKVGSAILPKSDLGGVQSVVVSENFDRIALSERTRGAVWDLKTGARKIHVRSFQGAFIDSSGAVYVDLPKHENAARSIALLDMNTGIGTTIRVLKTGRSRQVGRFLVELVAKPGTYKAGTGSDEIKKKELESARQTALALFGVPGYTSPEMRLEVTDVISGRPVWSREFDAEIPGYSFSPGEKTVTLQWPLASKAARDIIQSSSELSERARALGEKDGDYLIEVHDAEKGAVTGRVLIETGRRSFRITGGFTAGDFLTLIDSENRVLFYSIKSGELKARAFGEYARVNPVYSIAVVENLPGVLSIENLASGKKIGELRFASPIIYVKFTDDGSKLFVLTAAQEFYILDSTNFREGH